MKSAHKLFLLLSLCLLMGCEIGGIGIAGSDDDIRLKLDIGANGSLTASGSNPYERSEIVTLTAVPDAGYQVASWSGTMDDASAALVNYVRMDEDKTVSIRFEKAVVLSGTVTFDHVPATASGLDYGSTTSQPVRGAVVSIRDQTSNVIYSQGNLDATGQYSLSAPENTDIRIVVTAALGTPGDEHTLVVDNTDGESLYSLFLDMTSPAVDTGSIDLHAASGWGTTNYTGTRAAAPFAILDVIYQAEQMVLAVDPDVVFPQLTINWSVNNNSVFGDVSDGDIGTSYYSPNGRALFILGAEDEDTDEYDAGVIAHEWAHYFEDQFSRSDSTGGPHIDGDILDPCLALSEGFANALSGIIRGTNEYFDTSGVGQASVAVQLDLEADSTTDTDTFAGDTRLLDGYWSEASVQEIIYDIMDSDDDGSDTISLGFNAIYDVLTQDFKDSPAFTTLPTFLHHLMLQQSSANDTVIEAIANDENVFIGDEFDTGNTAAGMRMYTEVAVAVEQSTDVDGNNIATSDLYQAISTANNNKLLHRRFFKVSNLAAGTYTITMKPNSGEQFTLAYVGEETVTAVSAGQAIDEFTHEANGDFTFAVGTIGSAGQFSVLIDVSAAPGGNN